MKIVRATTTDKNAFFDTTFQEDITIAPYSQLGLQHIIFQPDPILIKIDSTNNEITYAVKTGNKRTVSLVPKTYTRQNFNDLLTNIQVKLNADLNFDRLSRNMGLQFKIERNDDNNAKIELEYRIGHFTQGTAEKLSELVNTTDDGTEFHRLSKSVGRSASMLIGGENAGGLCTLMPFNKGCGVIRTKIDLLDTKVGSTTGIIDGQNGFYLALINRQYFQEEIQLQDIVAGVYINGVGDSIRTYQNGIETVHDGTGGTSNIVPVKYNSVTSGNDFSKRDVYEISLQDGIFRFRQYIDGADDNIVDLCGYNGTDHLIPIIGIKGGSTRCVIAESIITFDPFVGTDEIVLDPTVTSYTHTHTNGLGALESPVNPPAPSDSTHQNYLEFQSLQLANYLGFSKLVYDFVTSTNFTGYIWVADNVFEPSGASDCYAIEVLSIPLESYDGIAGHKRNILHYIPVENQDKIIAYEPENQNFIEINNRNPISLRHLRMRVLSNNLLPIETVGTSSLALIIREQK